MLAICVVLPMICGCPPSSVEDVRKGNVYLKNGQDDLAEQSFRKAVETDPKSSEAREGLGNLFYERRDFEQARRWYQEAIQVTPGAITPRHKLALTLAELGQTDQAIAALEEAVKLAPKNPYALSLMGGLWAKKGEMKEAERNQLAALAVDEDYHAARYALANAFLATDRVDEAEREFSELLKRGAKPLAEYGFARLAAKTGKTKQAASHLRDLLRMGVSEPRRILSDPIFAEAWRDPEMSAIRLELESETSTSGAKGH